MSSDPSPPRRKPWEEKNPVVSFILAFLVPGAGHFYQGRWFKGWVYFLCILGTFFSGMQLGEGAVVYNLPNNKFGLSLSYLGQVCVGLPALPAIQQAKRAKDSSNRPQYELLEPLTAEFRGKLIAEGPGPDQELGEVVGTLSLEPSRDGPIPETRGSFRGTLDGQPIEFELAGGLNLSRPISAGYRRAIECSVARGDDQHPQETRTLRGSIPRSLLNSYGAPPEPQQSHELHLRLGKLYDLAFTCTWIAGLLNILAIWDALLGPAYGFGDEPEPTPEPAPTPAPAA
jgi:TM2 domain-containing membrane protein YozV